MKLLGEGEGFKVYDAGAGRAVVFTDGRTTDRGRSYFGYRTSDASKYPEYEKAITPVS